MLIHLVPSTTIEIVGFFPNKRSLQSRGPSSSQAASAAVEVAAAGVVAVVASADSVAEALVVVVQVVGGRTNPLFSAAAEGPRSIMHTKLYLQFL